ncbi:MAG: rhodanese-like domain-containing protein [Weeksellaceae bacterium]|jgi:rhodanese-related sulfurtransferase|nr:rhodanese-like domain-containing protein [Weeksellaceae bacterium]
MKNLSQNEWQDAVANNKDAVVIDVRTIEECRMGMIENAIRLDITQTELFIEEIQKMDKSKDYYLYCAAGGRSGTACAIMYELGFENVFNLIGGFSCWCGNTVQNAE